ncbi:outer membrane lipoprotein chaperone LolA [Marinobacter salicampi]|uniref:outer membrane lipoprotein chaperone LolA n=1 Tax=Marinobacter salicampi TaxID=435907 RepID=UPI00140A2ED9|nr:outer membrane lipoprotein chaperone LolA [Marinobacter salicampi]
MIAKHIWVWGLAMVVSATAAMAQDNASAEQLADELRNYRTYQADFVQTVTDAQGNKVQESRGKLKAKRPGLFYWETSEPMSQYIVADGKKVEVYDPDLEQVTVHPLDEQIASTPALLLSGEVDNLQETYQVRSRSFGDKTMEYTLEPRSEDSLFLSLTMTFYSGELQEMRLNDSLDQRSVLRFDNIEINEDIPDSKFELDYPEGVDVIQGNG